MYKLVCYQVDSLLDRVSALESTLSEAYLYVYMCMDRYRHRQTDRKIDR